MKEAEIRKEIIGLRKQWQEKGKNPMVWNDGKPFINNEFIEDLVALFKSERERLVREVEGLGYYKVKLFDGFVVGEKKSKVLLRKEVLKIIQANKEEEKEN